MSDHSEIRHTLSEYIDGSMTPEEKARVERHLERCSLCRDAVTELQRTIGHIRNADEIEPPPWMTAKIMARVRAEEEEKKQALFRRIFFPLHIKLPLEALGVVTLAVTALLIFRNVQAPTDQADGIISGQRLEQSPAAPQGQKRTTKKEYGRPPVPKGVPPQPAYKALDMKQEYETPPPPVAAEKTPAPLPSQQEQSAEPEERLYSGSDRRQAAKEPASAPAFSASGLSGAKRDRTTLAEARRAPAEQYRHSVRCSLVVENRQEATAKVAKAVRQLGGNVEPNEAPRKTAVMKITIGADKMEQLLDQLETIGELQEKELPSRPGDEKITIDLMIRQH